VTDLTWTGLMSRGRGPARVLVVDDEPLVRRSMVSAVQSLGYEAVAASSAEEALERLAEESFHAGLFDVRLPGLSGVDLLGQALERFPELAVVMLTGVGESSVALECLDLGARGYLLKPLDLAFLTWALNDAIALRALLVERNRLAVGGGPSEEVS
jgi:DNA-binding NarL/FixJ family response regulator